MKKINNLSFYYKIFKPYTIRILTIILLTIFISIINVAQPYVIKELLDDGVLNKNKYFLFKYIFQLIALFILMQVTFNVKKAMTTILAENILCDLRNKIHINVLQNDINFFNNKNIGELMNRILQELSSIINFVLINTTNILYTFFSAIIVLIVMISINIRLSLIILLASILTLITMKVFSKPIKNTKQKSFEYFSQIGNLLNEDLTNIKLIKYLNLYDFCQEKISSMLVKFKYNNIRLMYISIAMNVIISFFCFLPMIFVYGYGGYMVISGSLTIGILIAFSSYMQSFMGSIGIIANINTDFQAFKVNMTRIKEILNFNEINNKGIFLKNINYGIKFDNVSFSYKNRTIFDNISFTLEKGKINMVKGRNGIGKSTLIDILCDLYKPVNGEIYYDEIPLKDIDTKCFKDLISVIPQSIQLFSTSIKSNIILDRDITDEYILSLAKELEFDNINKDFLYKTISSNGLNLSGGEKQKISILRALISNPEILIIDEGLSFLDYASKKSLINYILKNKKKFITLIITHENTNDIYYDNLIDLDNVKTFV